MQLRRTIFGKGQAEEAPASTNHNTVIGGMATAIPDKATLATRLEILEADISFFQIDGNDVLAKIEVNYILPQSEFSNESAITCYLDYDDKVTEVKSSFYNCTNLSFVRLYGVVSVWNDSFRLTIAKEYALPKCIELTTGGSNDFYFYDCKNVQTIFLGNCTKIGFSHANDQTFDGKTPLGFEIFAHPDMQTIYNGGEEGDLAWARANRSAVIEYVTMNTTKPEVPTISISKTFGTGFEIAISQPVSANPITRYEVFVNGRLIKIEPDSSGIIAVGGLAKNTTYTIALKASDKFYNVSGFSNELSATTANQSIVSTTNLLAYFKLDETSGNFADSHNGYVGTPYGSPTRQTGKIGNGVTFDGTDDYISVDIPSITEGDFTISVWAKTVGANLPTAISQGIPADWSNNLFMFYLGESVSADFEARVFWNGASRLTYVGNGGVTTSEFNHYLLRKKGDVLELYKNGVKVKEGTMVGTWVSTARFIGAGDNKGTMSQFFTGSLDEIAFYNAAVSDVVISDLYNNGNGVTL